MITYYRGQSLCGKLLMEFDRNGEILYIHVPGLQDFPPKEAPIISGIQDLNSPLETLMEDSLKNTGIKYISQYAMYDRLGKRMKWNPKYIVDFVVFGKQSKIAIECDGVTYHSTKFARAYDTERDIWLLNRGFDDVLRFDSEDIRQDLSGCLKRVQSSIANWDQFYKNKAIKGLNHMVGWQPADRSKYVGKGLNQEKLNMPKKMKFYVVWKGNKEGIYTTWDECKQQVLGVPGAKYKSFSSLEEAEQAYSNGWKSNSSEKNRRENTYKTQGTLDLFTDTSYLEESICVDAACSGNPGAMEYKGVYTKNGKVLFHFGPTLGTNNIGEFLAIVHGLSFVKKYNKDLPIYSDSLTAIKWVRVKRANTSLPRNRDTERVWKLIERAENWLKENDYKNKVLKWETNRWGEVKADFGRK